MGHAPLDSDERSLAAIMFTDVVGFSQRMNQNEDDTLGRVRADLKWIREQVETMGGSVLKNTGDGLLAHFTSAVRAVRCAHLVQLHFHERAREDDQALLHRIGIHLGDVFMADDDVMGDGVNIAARLQSKADPGGICISQTVFDVVKNKLELKTTFLGACELKNIADKVPIYSVLLSQEGAPGQPVSGRPSRIHISMIAGALIILVGVALAVWRQSQNRPDPVAETTPEMVPANEIPGAGPETTRAPVAETRGRPRDGLAASLDQRENILRDWIREQLSRYTKNDPLHIRDLPGAPDLKLVFWQAENGQIFVDGPRGVESVQLENMDHQGRAGLLFSLLRADIESGGTPPRVVLQTAGAYFRRAGLTAHVKAMQRLRQPGQ